MFSSASKGIVQFLASKATLLTVSVAWWKMTCLGGRKRGLAVTIFPAGMSFLSHTVTQCSQGRRMLSDARPVWSHAAETPSTSNPSRIKEDSTLCTNACWPLCNPSSSMSQLEEYVTSVTEDVACSMEPVTAQLILVELRWTQRHGGLQVAHCPKMRFWMRTQFSRCY